MSPLAVSQIPHRYLDSARLVGVVNCRPFLISYLSLTILSVCSRALKLSIECLVSIGFKPCCENAFLLPLITQRTDQSLSRHRDNLSTGPHARPSALYHGACLTLANRVRWPASGGRHPQENKRILTIRRQAFCGHFIGRACLRDQMSKKKFITPASSTPEKHTYLWALPIHTAILIPFKQVVN